MALRAYACWAAAGKEAQYDEKAKRLLGNKTVLAHILIRTIDELSQGIMEKGIERGIEKGRAEGRAEGKAEGIAEMILNMHNAGFTIEQIVLATRKDEAEVRTVIEKGEPVLA